LFGSGGGTGDSNRVDIRMRSNGAIDFLRVVGGSGATFRTTTLTSTSTDTCIIFTWDADMTNLKGWINSRTEETKVLPVNTRTVQNTSQAGVMSDGTTTNPPPSGTRFYAVSLGDAEITDADAEAIIDEYNTRHSRTYV